MERSFHKYQAQKLIWTLKLQSPWVIATTKPNGHRSFQYFPSEHKRDKAHWQTITSQHGKSSQFANTVEKIHINNALESETLACQMLEAMGYVQREMTRQEQLLEPEKGYLVKGDAYLLNAIFYSKIKDCLEYIFFRDVAATPDKLKLSYDEVVGLIESRQITGQAFGDFEAGRVLCATASMMDQFIGSIPNNPTSSSAWF